jgi:hypothetical protein
VFYQRVVAASESLLRPVLTEIIAQGVKENIFDTADPEGVADLLQQLASNTHPFFTRIIGAAADKERLEVLKAFQKRLRLNGIAIDRYVTDEQRSRRPIFIATLWAGASWLFFRVARSTRMTQIWALRSRLEKQPTDLRQYTCYFRDRTLVACVVRRRS